MQLYFQYLNNIDAPDLPKIRVNSKQQWNAETFQSRKNRL